MFFTLFGDWMWGGGGPPNGVVHNPLLQFFTLYKNRRLRNLFFYNVTTHNDQPSYVKHVLGSVCVFFTLYSSTIEVSETYFFDIVMS